MILDQTFWQTVAPAALFAQVGAKENREHVMRVMRTLTPDPIWTQRIISQVEAEKIETRCFASWAAAQLQPKTYLEVGVRRGFSMAMVATQSPETRIYGFDGWIKGYAGMGNPGPSFVQSEMKRVGYRQRVAFVSGNSHDTLPEFFLGPPTLLEEWGWKKRDREFDLITVDGDHSLLGAFQDLMDVMPHCRVGGIVLFDDIAPDAAIDPKALAKERGRDPHKWRDLLGVWHAIQKNFPNFRYFEFTKDSPGVALAVRLE